MYIGMFPIMHVHNFMLCCSSQSVTIYGTTYKPGSVIRVTKLPNSFYYALIKEIFLLENEKLFAVEKLSICTINAHLCAIQVKTENDVEVVPFKSIFCHGVLHLKWQSHKMYLIEKNNSLNNLWYHLI